MNFKLLLSNLVIIFISTQLFHAQTLSIWTGKEIEKKESELISAYSKFEKKPGNKSRLEEFVKAFNERKDIHLAAIRKIESQSDLNRNWIDWMNRLQSLQYIYHNTEKMLPQANLPVQNYQAKIDSIKQLSIVALYERGQKALDNIEMPQQPSIAYRSLMAVQELQPNYKTVSDDLKVLQMHGNKGAYLEPLQYQNSGNYLTVNLSGDGVFDKYYRDQVTKDVEKQMIGFVIQNSQNSNTSYVINSNWKSINFGNGFPQKMTYERSVKQNDKDITATITYERETIPINTEFDVTITDKLTGELIGQTTIKTNNQAVYTTATYTGDKNALTMEDNDIINKTQFGGGITKFKDEQLKVVYDSSIHQRLLQFINNTIGW